MKELINQLSQEISKSQSKFKNLKTDSFDAVIVKNNIFTKEVLRLNKKLPEIINLYTKTNKLTANEIDEIKSLIDNSMTGLIANSGLDGINKNFRFDFDIENLKS